MADASAISWTDATFNPWIGCEKVSPACAHCYAETLATNRMGLRDEESVWGADANRRIVADSTWRKPVRWQRLAETGLLPDGERNEDGHRPRVFCASMADVFEARRDLEEPRRRLFDLIEATPDLDWLLLTKRPEVARAWLYDFYRRRGAREWVSRDGLGWGVLPNVWVGVSVENQRWTWRADVLREIPAAVRFVSAEPLLDGLVGSGGERRTIGAGRRSPLDLDGIDWLIVGGESGGRESRPMRVSWARELRDLALDRGVAFHFKQWGSYAPLIDDGHPSEYRDALTAYGERFAYRGPAPKSAGKLLDGVEYCDFPAQAVPA